MQALHLVVVGGNDGFFTGKVVVGSAGGYLCSPRDVAYGGNFKTTFPKEFKRRLQNHCLGLLAGGLIGCPHSIGLYIERVQILAQARASCQAENEHVQYSSMLFKFSCIRALWNFRIDLRTEGSSFPGGGPARDFRLFPSFPLRFRSRNSRFACLGGTCSGKMPVIAVGSEGLISRGTFQEHFSFHSWQAEMDCQTAFEREADSQTRLAP